MLRRPPSARRALAVALALVVTVAPVYAAQSQFLRLEGARDFLEGELAGLSVDSNGRVRLAPGVKVLQETETPFVWCLATDGKGTVFVGTGNEGKVFRIEGGKASVAFDAAELEVHALAHGPDGKLYVGTSPDGKVYAVEPGGKSTTFFDPKEKYIWSLAFDHAGNLIVATGAEGRVYRVDPKGGSSVILQTAETHVLSLAVDPRGTVFAGSAPSGILYRIDTTGKVFVVYDSAYREVKSLDLGRDGSVYAALVDSKPPDDAPRPATGTSATPGPTSEVVVTESFGGPAVGASTTQGATPAPGSGTNKGAVIRLLPGGEVDSLWSSAEDTPQALVSTADGVLVATGSKGKLYRVRDDRTWTLLAVLPAEQLTGLARRSDAGAVVASSSPGKVFSLDDAPGERGTFVSKAKDTETVSAWGRLRWEGEMPVGTDLQVQTRSGNTQTPDATWSDWSTAYKDASGQAIASERARFLQMRATLVGKDGKTPVLDRIIAAYLQRNLRPEVPQVTIHPPGEVFQKPISVTGDPEILGLDTPTAPAPGAPKAPPAPAATSFSRKLYQRGLQTFSWRAEDANGDTLSYDVYFKAVNESRFRLLRKDLVEPVLAWDTSTVPNGRYVIKVVASDAPSNPGGLALTGEKESTAFDVDNTPPAVTASLASRSPLRVRAVAKDDASALRKAEYSIDGGRWEEVYPLDGINDAKEETYEFSPEGLSTATPHVVVIRVIDLLGNASSARVEIVPGAAN
ncbi:MAG TPA: WD40 repeat domain-containing protein [Vicinamibacteria bacterium]|nr:WD40 repeat domain-containing protein [Vicinamibacteria bacterium]